MKIISKLMSIVLALSILSTNVIYAKENISTSIEKKIKEGKVIEVIESNSSKYNELDTIEKINDDIVDEFMEVAEVLIVEKENGAMQYIFKEKKPSKKVKYDNGLEENNYKIVSLLTIPAKKPESASFYNDKSLIACANKSSIHGNIYENMYIESSYDGLLLDPLATYNESKSKELKNTDVLIRATMYYKSYDVDQGATMFTASKITKGTAQVVKNYENYGRNLKFYMKCDGMRLDSNGNSQGIGKETSTTYVKSSPTIGVTYSSSPSFTYFYEVSTCGLLGLYVTYEVSHNGSTYYTYSLSITEGSIW